MLTPAVTDSLAVNLNERSYAITFGEDLAVSIRASLAELKHQGRKAVVLTDANLAGSQASFLSEVFGDLPRLVVEPGESAKSIHSLGAAWDFLAAQRVDRGGVVIAVGGGVIGDLSGFVAASWLRGVDFFQVPTTLLAMVDSSVGGKTGINIAAGKNLVGAFHQPKGVFVATGLLRTLPAREFAAGMAEVIKYGLLGDADLLARLERSPLMVDSPDLPKVIKRCCAIKAGIVQADERETVAEGGRALLNLGHTFGHAIEQVAGYGVYLHGEAVALGLVAATHLSVALGHLPTSDAARVEAVLAAHALPVKLRTPLPLPDLMAAVARDKKVRAGLPRFVVMTALGEAATREGIDSAMAEACFSAIGAGD
ncbi:MAG: 3-dehydroquinate synthase [Verrucomicrobiota bacterium]